MAEQILACFLIFVTVVGLIGWLPGYLANFVLVYAYCFYKGRSVQPEMFYPPRMLKELRLEDDAFPFFFPLLTGVMCSIIMFQAIKYIWLSMTRPFNIRGVSSSFHPHHLFAACFNMFLPKKGK